MAAQERLTRMLGLGDGSGATGWRAAGVTIAAFAPAYWWAAAGQGDRGRRVPRLRGCRQVQRGAIVVVLFNDAVWLPAFARLALVRSNRHAT
jgi:hypothetical protein